MWVAVQRTRANCRDTVRTVNRADACLTVCVRRIIVAHCVALAIVAGTTHQARADGCDRVAAWRVQGDRHHVVA